MILWIFIGLVVAWTGLLAVWLKLGDPGVEPEDDDKWESIDYPERKS